MSKSAIPYSPLYFLSSVGAGGLTFTFFTYLMFWVPHPGRNTVFFEDILATFGNGSFFQQLAILVAVVGIAFFSAFNVHSLVWNLRQFSSYVKTPEYIELRRSNAETSCLAVPLAIAMTLNTFFIVGLVFLPGLSNVIHYILPIGLLGFILIGLWCLTLIGQFLIRVLPERSFDLDANNSLIQLLPAFALAVVSVGVSSPAMLSTNTSIVGAALVASTIFATMTVLWVFIAVFVALPSIIKHGTAREAAPTILMIIPIITMLGITILRQNNGLHTVFGARGVPGESLYLLADFLIVQVAVLLVGLIVLYRQGYFSTWVFGPNRSPLSFSLICPGVSLSVMIHFFVNKGLVEAGMITKFDTVYWLLMVPAFIAQFIALGLELHLSRHFQARCEGLTCQPAE